MKAVNSALLALLIQVPGYSQTSEMQVVVGAAEALGGRSRIEAVRSVIMEGSGRQPTIGQNLTPDAPLPDWAVPEFKRTIDLANGRMRVEQHRVAQFPFAMANDVRQNMVVDGTIAYNVDPGTGNPTRASDAAAADRRIDMLDNPITIVRAALDSRTKLANLREEGKRQALDITTRSEERRVGKEGSDRR